MRRYDHDVIVVGGGMAGLIAARDLARRGVDVLLLESRHRLGGRVFTQHVDGWPLPIELGAEFVHGDAPATRALALEARAALRPIDEQHLYKMGRELTSMSAFWERLPALLGQVDPDGPDRSAADVLRASGMPPDEQRVFAMFVEGFHAAPLDRVSMRSLAAQLEGGEGQGRLVGGYDPLVVHLEGQLERLGVQVRRATVARGVHWSAEHADVTVQTGTELHARAAVVALPHAVLRAPDTVRFTPEIAEQRTQLARVETGHAIRVVLRLRTPIWERAGMPALSFVHDPTLAFPTWWTAAPDTTPQLTAWCGGPSARPIALRPFAAIVEQVRHDLAALLDVDRGAVDHELIEAHCHAFSVDPWSRGAYSYVAVGGIDAPERLETPQGDALFFAGEYTVPADSGTVEAALVSGHRAAAQVLDSLG
ncbi:MAG TPA: NAD(P)/FAD-dependent oxidoreductase [Candidatus Binatia bacterium]|jgi:monoamine oxidase|nr:NAD(P)/FAD-dependent oxidoreductase [Candidatus Binatia bacterium]